MNRLLCWELRGHQGTRRSEILTVSVAFCICSRVVCSLATIHLLRNVNCDELGQLRSFLQKTATTTKKDTQNKR